MAKINAFFETFLDEELYSKLRGRSKVVRMFCNVKFKTPAGFTKPYPAIIDTGAHTSIIPSRIWKMSNYITLGDHYTQKPRKLLTSVMEMNGQEFLSSGFLVSQKLLGKRRSNPTLQGWGSRFPKIFHDVAGLVPGAKLEVKVGEVSAIFVDLINTSKEYTFLCFLSPNDRTPLILGFKELLSEFSISINYPKNTASLEEK